MFDPEQEVEEERELVSAFLPDGNDEEDDADEDADDAETDDDGDEPDEEVDADKETDPDKLAAELARTRKALKKANAEAAKLRRGEKEDDEDDDDSPAKLREELNRRDAAEALREAGIQGSKGKLLALTRLLDSIVPSKVDDAIDDLKESMPELFESKTPPPRAPRVRRPAGSGPTTQETPTVSKTTKRMLRQAQR